MTSLRPGTALLLLAAVALCAPLAACDDKRRGGAKQAFAPAGNMTGAVAGTGNPNAPPGEQPNTENSHHFVANAYV